MCQNVQTSYESKSVSLWECEQIQNSPVVSQITLYPVRKCFSLLYRFFSPLRNSWSSVKCSCYFWNDFCLVIKTKGSIGFPCHWSSPFPKSTLWTVGKNHFSGCLLEQTQDWTTIQGCLEGTDWLKLPLSYSARGNWHPALTPHFVRIYLPWVCPPDDFCHLKHLLSLSFYLNRAAQSSSWHCVFLHVNEIYSVNTCELSNGWRED